MDNYWFITTTHCTILIAEIPMGQAPLDMINADDVGGVVCNIFRQGTADIHKTFSLSGDKLTVPEMAALMSGYLAPRVFRDTQVSILNSLLPTRCVNNLESIILNPLYRITVAWVFAGENDLH